jgi:phenylalanyl-tRNA synthetase beta chain
MRAPLEWLREYCAPDLDVHGIEERLTMTGTKVEAVHHFGVADAERLVVARVLECAPHPDADRLSVCTVDVGEAGHDGPVTIVCGAPNVAAEQSVVVALPGALMPDGSEIAAVKLRGVRSEGMICSEQELAIGPGGEGILVLDGSLEDAPSPGAPLSDVLAIATDVLELEITPNRPDCLGMYGVARELHAATGAPLASPPWQEDPGSAGPLGGDPGAQRGPARTNGEDAPAASVDVRCPDLCPRFTARVFEHVTIAPSPPWLKARLSAAGQRPINNVVDITNYVMLATGQPLHAFDLDRVAGARLTARRAHEGEQLTTLDGQVRTLDGEMIVIEDADGPTSIAGLMGGARSEVHDGTTRVLLEVANWYGPSIHRASWALGLRSEASSRFEKGLAPEQCGWAQALATRLTIELCGASVLPGTIDIGGEGPKPPTIRLRERRVQAILGVQIERARQQQILQALDFDTVAADDGLDVSPPPVRREDVTREADLIEEVARIDGLERLPATLPKRRGAYGVLSREQRLQRRTVDALVGRGLYEAVGWTFISRTLFERLRLGRDDPRRAAPALENPLSEEQSLLRTTLLGSLLDTAAHNRARGIEDVRLFEVGTVFARSPDRETGVFERRALGVLLSGRLQEPSWNSPDARAADFYAVKAVLEALASALRVHTPVLVPARESFLHPGRCATIHVGERAKGAASDGDVRFDAADAGAGAAVGWIGELHPLVATAWGLPGGSCFELDLDRLIAAAPTDTAYEDLIGYPALRQDIAVILPDQVSAQQALASARAAAGELLRDVRVFDVYVGPRVGEGRRSLALALSFRAADRTLTDEDVAPVRERIVAALAGLGGELRG